MEQPASGLSSGRVGPYRIARRLGAGGMGVVYLGHHETSGIAAAVKVIRPEYVADPAFRERLRREVAAARRVPRFCTAPVLADDLDAEPPWVATEYIDAPTLDVVLLERGKLDGGELDGFAVGVAVALRAIHDHGVIHRDLKPSNVLVSPAGPRVIDFGIARVQGADTQLTLTGVIAGTPAYLAPELLRGEPASAAVDVFAWAGLVTYAATGRPAFGTGDAAMYAILHAEPDLSGLQEPLRELVARAFDKEPSHRPTAAELVDLLSREATAVTTRVLASADAAPAPAAPGAPSSETAPVAPARLAVPAMPPAPVHQAPTVVPRRPSNRRAMVAGSAGALALLSLAAVSAAIGFNLVPAWSESGDQPCLVGQWLMVSEQRTTDDTTLSLVGGSPTSVFRADGTGSTDYGERARYEGTVRVAAASFPWSAEATGLIGFSYQATGSELSYQDIEDGAQIRVEVPGIDINTDEYAVGPGAGPYELTCQEQELRLRADDGTRVYVAEYRRLD